MARAHNKKNSGENSTETWHDKHLQNSSFGDRVADGVTMFVGSWWFILIHVVWFAGWFFLNIEPFPFGLLTLVVSLEAIFLSTIILISQNREMDRDRHQAQADFDTNVRAKEEIEALQTHLSRLEIDKLDKILRILDREDRGPGMPTE